MKKQKTVVLGRAYDFGPDGLTFRRPTELTLSFDTDLVTDETPAIAFLRDGAWQSLLTSTVRTTDEDGTIIFTADRAPQGL